MEGPVWDGIDDGICISRARTYLPAQCACKTEVFPGLLWCRSMVFCSICGKPLWWGLASRALAALTRTEPWLITVLADLKATISIPRSDLTI